MERQIKKLEFRISIYLPLAWVFVLGALVPLFFVAIVVLGNGQYWHEEELGSFIGGVSGTLAALAGVFFVYVAFLGQRISIIQQQIELQDNRKELRETREEIKGQKEQLKLQNKQFQIQSFETVLFQLIRLYKDLLSSSFQAEGQVPRSRISNFEEDLKRQQKYSGDPSEKEKIILVRREAFMNYFYRLENQTEALIRSIYGICVHIYFHREIINEKYYLGILYRQLNKTEINLIFYGFFSREGMYLPNQQYERILAEFLRSIDIYKLFTPSDINLLNDIPKPDTKFLSQN